MSRRFYPRNDQSRRDAQLGPGHIAQHVRNEQSRRAGLASDPKQPTLTIGVTGTAAAATETEIVEGGETIIFTISAGWDRFAADLITNAAKLAALVAGLSNATVSAALTSVDFALSSGNSVLTVTLPEVAAYAITVEDTITWSIPAGSFENRADAFAAGTVAVVTPDA